MARTAGADLTAAAGSAALSPAQADAAIWLGLAQTRLGRAEAARAVAARFGTLIAATDQAALLRLATMAAEPTDGLAAAIRADLAVLPALAADQAAVRTASARSNPAG